MRGGQPLLSYRAGHLTPPGERLELGILGLGGRAVLLEPFQPCTAGVGNRAASLDKLKKRAGLAVVLACQAIESLNLRDSLGALGHTQPAAELLEPRQRRTDLLPA